MNCKCALGSFCFSAKGQIANCPNRSIVASLATVCRRPFFWRLFFLKKGETFAPDRQPYPLIQFCILAQSCNPRNIKFLQFVSPFNQLGFFPKIRQKCQKGNNLKIVILVHVSQFYKRLHSTVQPFSVLAIAFATIRGNNRKRQDDIVALLLLSLLPFCTW